MQKILKRYGIVGSIILVFYTLYSRLVYGKTIRVIKCIPHLINRDRIFLGRNFTAGKGLRIEAVGEPIGSVVIGANVTFNDYVHVGAAFEIIIGNDSLIGSRVTIVDHDHGMYRIKNSNSEFLSTVSEKPDSRSLHGSKIVISENVWIGDGAVILAGVELGEGVVVGANSVVTKSFSKGSIVAGIPAKVIGMYK